LQREVRAAACQAEDASTIQSRRLNRGSFAGQTREGERQQNRQHQDQAPDGGERRADVLARRARDDPVAGPQQQRGEEHEPGGETHAQAIIACMLSSIMPRVTAAGRSLEYEWVGTERSGRPVLVFLHEGLGSIRQWRDFPQKLAEALGCRRARLRPLWLRAVRGAAGAPAQREVHARRKPCFPCLKFFPA